MYSSIRVRGYRGLDSFRMEGLGRVNLLVGTNNSGKTSILECIELLRSAGNPHVLASIASRRGEWGSVADATSRGGLGPRPEPLDVSRLFANQDLHSVISVEADRVAHVDTAAWNDKVMLCVEEASGSELGERDDAMDGDERLVLHVKWAKPQDDYREFVTDEGFLTRIRRPMRARNGSSPAAHFVSTRGMTAAEVVRTYSRFVFTEKGEAIKQALRIVEPAVEDIAPVADDRRFLYRDAPGGVVLKLRGIAGQVPVGSLGDGMWRILGLALAISNASGGALLVDEIDTGLHYTVMEDVWRMISERAAALSVQVFATTHSRDCYESLAAVVETDVGDVTIQRVDRTRGEAVSFSNQAIVAAAERNIEVR